MKQTAWLTRVLAVALTVLVACSGPASAAAAGQGTSSQGDRTGSNVSFETRAPLREDVFVRDVLARGQTVYLLASDEALYRYDSKSDAWKNLGTVPLSWTSTMALLQDGRILIIGGQKEEGSGYGHNVIYDPASGEFAEAAPLPRYIANMLTMEAITLPNGKVLAAGRYALYAAYQHLFLEYDPALDAWTEPVKVSFAADSLRMNEDGVVLNYGGGLDDHFPGGNLYVVGEDRFLTISSLPYLLIFSVTAALSDGSFLLAGGSTGAGPVIEPSVAALVFHPDRNEWEVVGFMADARVYADAVPLPDGRTLVIGGLGMNGALRTTEIYDPKTKTWAKGPSTRNAYMQPHAVQLGEDEFLVIGRTEDSSGRPVIAAERLQWSVPSAPRVPDEKPDAVRKKRADLLRGIPVHRETLFTRDGWTYRAEYMYEEDVFALFGTGDLRYTRMYMTRENTRSGQFEVVIDGRFTFLKLDGDWMYYMQDGSLRRMKPGERYGEVIRFPHTFRAEDPADPRWSWLGHWDLRAGAPIDLGMHAFDGEYLYTWWTSSGLPYEQGLPVRIHYTGSHLKPLSDQRGAERRGELRLNGEWLTYLTASSMPVVWERNRPYVLHAVKKDGSEKKDLAVTYGGYEVFGDRVYYRNAEDPVPGTIPAGKLYSMKLDGTDNKLLSAEGAGQIYRIGDTLVFETFSTGTIVSMNLDGSGKKVLLQGNRQSKYHLTDTGPNYIVYSHYDQRGERYRGSYRLYIPSLKREPADPKAIPIRVRIGGQFLAFDQEPAMINNRVMVPFRPILESLGAELNWDPATGVITARKGSNTIRIDGAKVTVNGEALVLDQPPVQRGGRTLVPVRVISKALDAEVYWVGRERSVNIIADK